MSPTVALTERPPADWLAFARAHGSFYHDPRWGEALARCFGFRLHALSLREGDRLEGLLLLAEVPGLVGRRRLVSLPFSYAAGPLTATEVGAAALVTAAVERARAVRARRLEIKSDSSWEPGPGLVRVQHYATYRVDTAGGEHAVWRRLHPGSTQRGIRRSEKLGVRVEQPRDVAGWRVMADLETRTARRHGVPGPPERFFTETCLGLERDGLATMYLARLADGQIAAGVTLWLGPRRWIYAFGASRPELLDARPNHALLWRALQDAIAAGVEFDLGRAAPEQQGLVEFKRRWGGEPVPLGYDYWPTAAGLNTRDRHRGPLAWAAAAWSHLPLPLTRAGSVLYRYLG